MSEHVNFDESDDIDARAPGTPDGDETDHDAELTPAQLAESKRYGRQRLVFSLSDSALDVAFLAVLALVIARPLDAWLFGWPLLENRWLRLGAFFVLVSTAHLCLSFPLAFYTGHVLEHRFGLSRQSFTGWLWRLAKKNVLTLGFGLLMVEGLYLVIWLTGSFWWLAATAAFFVVSVGLGQLVPVLILPLFYKIRRLDDEALLGRFKQLAAGTGLAIEGIYRMEMSSETSKANAMLTGLGRTRRVILGDTLLEGFTPDEIEVVLAHEVGHHVFRHIPKLIVIGLAYSAVSFFLCDRILAAWLGGDFDYAALPVYALPMLMFSISVFSLLLGPLKNTVVRHFERQCDRYALDRTGFHNAYRTAFTKLAKQNKSDPDPPALEVFLFHDHPPISERLKMADGN